MPALQSKRFCFTCNVLAPVHLTNVVGCTFGIVGQETAPSTGKQHYQGYYEFSKKVTLAWYKANVCDKCHVEIANGPPEANEKYCSKEAVVKTFGNRMVQGKRNDLVDMCDKLKEVPLHEMILDKPATYIRNYRGIANALCTLRPCAVRKVTLISKAELDLVDIHDIYHMHVGVDCIRDVRVPYHGQSVAIIWDHRFSIGHSGDHDGSDVVEMIKKGYPICIDSVPCLITRYLVVQC